MKVLVSLLVFIKLCNTPSCVKKYVMEPNVFLGYPKRGIACLVNPSRHEQYPYNNLNQNNLAHGVTMRLNEGITFLLGFLGLHNTSPSLRRYMIWSPNYFRVTYNGVLHVH
jgi:hypothetical protein